MNEYVFSTRMREVRLNKKISQAELSRQTGIAPATLSSYEAEENPKSPPIDKAILIAKTLGVSLDWLCGLETEENNREEEYPFTQIIEAIIKLLSLESSKLEYHDMSDDETGGTFRFSAPAIIFDSQIIESYLTEYSKVQPFINSDGYDQYLKDSLKNAITSKFSKYTVNKGAIQSSDSEEVDHCVERYAVISPL